MDTETHFDHAALQVLKGIMEDDFSDLVQLFIDDSDARLSSLKQAVNDNDRTQVRDLAHSFKGASSNLSAVQLAELCFQLESNDQACEITELENLLERLTLEYLEVRFLLKNMI